MESPVFKLEKVVHSRSEEMQDFEGPLDLILFLLGKNKLEIQDISISLICGQYIAWLEDRQRMDLEVASEFVTMAAHLMYIKTRMLLSIEDDEAKSEMDALLQSLEERRRSEHYVRVKALAQRLAPMGEFGRNIVTRNPEPVKRGKVFEYSHQPADLVLAMAEIQNRAEIHNCIQLVLHLLIRVIHLKDPRLSHRAAADVAAVCRNHIVSGSADQGNVLDNHLTADFTALRQRCTGDRRLTVCYSLKNLFSSFLSTHHKTRPRISYTSLILSHFPPFLQ